MENIRDWAPGPETRTALESRLKAQGVPDPYARELSTALDHCGEASFRYLRLVHGYATTRELHRENFVPALAELVDHLQRLRDAAAEYSAAFKRFDAMDRPNLRSDKFDTTYFDVIQGLDVREFLKSLLDEAAPVLRAMSMTSAEIRGARLTDLFEQCVRYHLYVRYFLVSEKRGPEEVWSLLFDLDQLFSGEEGSVEILLEDLDEMKLELERVQRLN